MLLRVANQSRNYGAGGWVHPLKVCGEYLIFFTYHTQLVAGGNGGLGNWGKVPPVLLEFMRLS